MTSFASLPTSLNSLQGKRIVVTAYDLEQSEHRGIAVYTKSLIHCLRKAGSEVWLLTEYGEPLRDAGLRSLPKATKSYIFGARVLDSLAHGIQSNDNHLNWIERRVGFARKISTRYRALAIAIELARRPRYYRRHKIYQIPVENLFDNPYIRNERLSYLKDVTGLLCVRNVFLSTMLASRLKRQRPVRIDLKGFDALLTSCPLNIKPLNSSVFVQTVHDLIPLEYVQHNEDPLMFSHRLQACIPAKRIYVSTSTSIKFHNQIQNQAKVATTNKSQQLKSIERVVVQPPSLRFPSWLSKDHESASDLKPISNLFSAEKDNDTDKLEELSEYKRMKVLKEKQKLRAAQKEGLSAYKKEKLLQKKKKILITDKKNRLSSNEYEQKGLRPFQYFLFNSSVESRKNLLFLAKSYAESNLGSQGIRLCVTGKLKGDDYSNAIEEIVKHEPSILLTGYIDESTKLDLYLNAMALLSPSLVEGFGIPVLDAACLGMTAIASDCDSHREIYAMYDFEQYVLPISTHKSLEWATAMKAVAGNSIDLCNQPYKERKRRISRYEAKYKIICKQFQKDLEDLLC